MLKTDRMKKLAGLLNEQAENRTFDEQSKESLQKYAAWLRAIHLWFHGAHHTTKGAGFAGDHEDLFGKIYTEVQGEVDGAVEKIIGVTDDASLGNPAELTRQAAEIMSEYDDPATLSADRIVEVGLQMEKDYVAFVEQAFKELEESELLTLGLNDQMAASANTHETYVYLLQQRAKR